MRLDKKDIVYKNLSQPESTNYSDVALLKEGSFPDVQLNSINLIFSLSRECW